MGLLSNLVVAPADQAERVAQSQVPSQEFDGVDVSGIDSIKLVTLHSLLTGQTIDELMPLYDPVVEVTDEGPWVFCIPADMATALATLNEDRKHDVARQWSETEEFILDDWSEEDVTAALNSICHEAKKATNKGESLFLWISL